MLIRRSQSYFEIGRWDKFNETASRTLILTNRYEKPQGQHQEQMERFLSVFLMILNGKTKIAIVGITPGNCESQRSND
jgi:hypothetical protein